MGDRRATDWSQDFPAQSGDETASRLRDDAYGTLRRAGNDQTEEKGNGDQTLTSGNPFFHIQMAGIALQQLDEIKGKDPAEKIQLTDDQGAIREVTVGERREQLLKIADAEFVTAVGLADNIDQSKVPQTLLQIREQMRTTTSLAEFDKLSRVESTIESMKHAPSVTRFAYATFLADQGQNVKARQVLDQAAEKDSEAKLDPVFKQVYEAVDKGVQGGQDAATEGDNPFVTLGSADQKRKAGDAAGAEADYKTAIEQAGKLDPQTVAQQLRDIEDLKKQNADNPQALEQLKELEEVWATLGHAPAITKINFADFLIEQKRYKDALPYLLTAAQEDPDLVKDNKEFAQMVEMARNEGKEPEAFDNPFDHLTKVQTALDNKDLDLARTELKAACEAADKVDRQKMQQNKAVIDEQLKEEKDEEKRAKLEEMRKIYDAFDHASGFARIALARFEVANKNYNQAQELIADVERFDPELSAKPEMEMAKLKEIAQEPSTWDKVWGFAKGVLKELACDAVAVLAGIGAGLGVGALTSLTGPGAVVAGGAAGAAAGAAAYTFMKCVVFGEEFHWSMPLWGALDGASGGVAAAVRTGLVKVGGKIITQEMAEATVLKTGGSVAALEGLEGMKMAQTAQALSKEGLKAMGKNLGMWTRFKSAVPFINAGNAEYRAALGAYRGLKYANLGVKMGVDAGTVMAGSMVYRGGHEGYKLYTGEHKTFGDFAKAYGAGVAGDTLTGATMGAYGRGFGQGIMVSGLRRGTQEAIFGNHENFGQYSKAVMTGMGIDGAVSLPGWVMGDASGFIGRNMSGVHGVADSLWYGSSARWYDAYVAKNYADQVEATLQELHKPIDADEVLKRQYYMPGTNEYRSR